MIFPTNHFNISPDEGRGGGGEGGGGGVAEEGGLGGGGGVRGRDRGDVRRGVEVVGGVIDGDLPSR